MTFFAIVGRGPNDLEIPLVICQTREEAQAIVDQLPKSSHGNFLDDDFSECDGKYRTSDDSPVELYKLIFKDGRYYSGCGGCYSVAIVEYEYGKPMVGWDLD
jgi:hypothetical protein